MVSCGAVVFVLMLTMKQIKTFVLRLLLDEAQPDQIHGSLQKVSSETYYYFFSEQSLVEILRNMLTDPDSQQNFNLSNEKRDELNVF